MVHSNDRRPDRGGGPLHIDPVVMPGHIGDQQPDEHQKDDDEHERNRMPEAIL